MKTERTRKKRRNRLRYVGGEHIRKKSFFMKCLFKSEKEDLALDIHNENRNIRRTDSSDMCDILKCLTAVTMKIYRYI